MKSLLAALIVITICSSSVAVVMWRSNENLRSKVNASADQIEELKVALSGLRGSYGEYRSAQTIAKSARQAALLSKSLDTLIIMQRVQANLSVASSNLPTASVTLMQLAADSPDKKMAGDQLILSFNALDKVGQDLEAVIRSLKVENE